MKIAFLIHSLQLAEAERVIFDLIRHFSNRKIYCSLITIYKSGDRHGKRVVVRELESLGVPVYELHKKSGTGAFRILRQLNQLLTVLKPDVIHSHSFIPNVYAGIRNRMFHEIFTVSTLDSDGANGLTRKSVWLEKFAVQGINRVVSGSEQEAASYESKFKESKGKLVVIEDSFDNRYYSFERVAEDYLFKCYRSKRADYVKDEA